jgi:hypothetical protein
MTWTKALLISFGIIFLTAVILLLLGRFPFCKCEIISVWNGNIWSDQNSQQFTDPYTFTHITHGMAFYALLWFIARTWPVQFRMVAAVAIESVWEIVENTDFAIERYRAATISLNYYGDSVLNTIGDLGAMMLGFWIASRLPIRATLITAALLEAVLLLTIRDSLILNILMLFYPLESVKQWQMNL